MIDCVNMRQLSQKQKKLYDLLKEADIGGQSISVEEIATSTGYRKDSIKSYISLGYWMHILKKIAPNTYTTVGIANLTEQEFALKITQSNKLRHSRSLRNKLARVLSERSSSNALLAIELFNRPVLGNRIDAFVLLICTAWEQILKSHLIIQLGEDAIHKSQPGSKEVRTLSLRECLTKVVSRHTISNSVHNNLLEIVKLRDQAAHLTVPESQYVLTSLFQSTVNNFAKFYRSVVNLPFVENPATTVLVFPGNNKIPTIVELGNAYGADAGKAISEIICEIAERIAKANDEEFSMPLAFSLELIKSSSGRTADIVAQLVKPGENSAPIAMIEKPVNLYGHWIKTKLVVQRINDTLAARDVAVRINKFVFGAIVKLEGFDKGDNMYRMKDQNLQAPVYNPEIVDVIVRKIESDSNYTEKAKEALRQKRTR